MSLEDFFTLTEMKDGLSSLARVEELVAVMQKQKDCVLSTMGDAARQWSTVAGTLAATENKDCLNHFVQLNGLCFLNQWLQEVQKYTKDISENVVEELINALLSTLERLPIDEERSTATGLGITVEQLLGHKSLNIKDRARNLFDKWKNAMNSDVIRQGLEKSGMCPNDQPKASADSNTTEKGVCSSIVIEIFPSEGGAGEGSNELGSTGTESHHSNVTRCSDSSQADMTNDGKISTSDQIIPATSSNSVGAAGDTFSLGSSLVSNSCHENLSVTEESSVCPAVGMPSAGTCTSLVGRERDDQHDVSVFKDVNDGVEEMEVEVDTKESSLCNFTQKETCSTSSSSRISASIPVAAAEPQPCNFDLKGSNCISKTTELQAKNSGGVDYEMPDYLREPKFQYLSSNGCVLRKIDGPEKSFQRTEAVESADDNAELGSDANLKQSGGVDLMIPSDSSKAEKTKAPGEMDQKSVLGLEYEEIDALEVARQVAIEVEREVVDYREPFCSSPEVNSGEIAAVHSPDFVRGKKQQTVIEDGSRSPTGKDISDSSSSPKDGSRTSENIGTNPEELGQTLELPKETSVAEKSDEAKHDKNRCEFDLNEDICTQELDFSQNPVPNTAVNVSTPIAVVATTRGALGLPVTPLHFEGELGWRGSAATSAFRPASLRRTPDAEKSCSGPKEKPNFLGFDLNVAESEDGVAVDLASTKQILVSSSLFSGDDSMEVSSRRAERLKLDLNRLGDEDASICPSSNWRLCQNGDQSMSSASSSCSKQPFMRDFDLNDNPFFDAGNSCNLDKSSSKASCTYGSSKLDDPVVMIMGSRMAVERKDFLNQSQPSFLNQTQPYFLGNGSSMEPVMRARPLMPYPHMMPAPYGYNGLAAGPVMPIPPPTYGPGSIPYHMVDSRGFTVVPQVMASSSAGPPFLMSVTGAPSSLSGVGFSRPGLDLNSGLTSLETGSREGGSFKQLFMQGHGDLIVGQARTSSQPSNSGMPLKRKELERGPESYPLGYKQVTSWQ